MKYIGMVMALCFLIAGTDHYTEDISSVVTVYIYEMEHEPWKQVQISLESGDTLSTGADTSAEIIFLNKSRLIIPPETEVIFTISENGERQAHTRIQLNTGSVFLELNEQENLHIELNTANTVALVQHGKVGFASAGFYWIEEGSLEVMAVESGQISHIHAGMFAQVSEEGTDILTGQLARQEISRLNSEMELNTQELKFYYPPADNP